MKKKRKRGKKWLRTDIKIVLERKRQYHRDQNKNLYEEEKQKEVEYMRNYYLTHKNCS